MKEFPRIRMNCANVIDGIDYAFHDGSAMFYVSSNLEKLYVFCELHAPLSVIKSKMRKIEQSEYSIIDILKEL